MISTFGFQEAGHVNNGSNIMSMECTIAIIHNFEIYLNTILRPV